MPRTKWFRTMQHGSYSYVLDFLGFRKKTEILIRRFEMVMVLQLVKNSA
jgi:hypothetical protein